MKWDNFFLRVIVFSMAIYSTYFHFEGKVFERNFESEIKLDVFKQPKKDVCSHLEIFREDLRKIVVDYACHEYRQRQLQVDIEETPYQFAEILKERAK